MSPSGWGHRSVRMNRPLYAGSADLTYVTVKTIMTFMCAEPLTVIDHHDQAALLLEPTRLRIVRELAEPDSATGLAKRLNLPRQRVNYHLRELEKHGLVRLVEERRRRNCTERIVQATARSYLISPAALAELGSEPEIVRDRFSWSYLVSLAARAIRELAVLRRRADKTKQKVATLAIETEVRFASPDALRGFSEELANHIAGLAAKYHDERSDQPRLFRVVLGAYPAITKPDPTDSTTQPPSHQPTEEP